MSEWRIIYEPIFAIRYSLIRWSTFDDGNLGHYVAVAEGIDHVLPLGYLAKDSMLAIQVRLWAVANEELRAIGIGAGVGHA
jgi:hypothetical protein